MQYPIDLFDNHVIVVDNNKKFLIDTGSPISISNENEIEIFGMTYGSTERYLGANIDEISNLVGCHLDALIGNNVLKNFIFQIDFKNQLFFVWDSLPRETINIDEYIDAEFTGMPTIQILINQKPIRSFIDTGAKISYLNKQYVQRFDPLDKKEDFLPGFGKFETPIYNIPMTFYGKEIPFKFGILPHRLEEGMLAGSVQAILGADIFSHFTLIFHHANNKIYIKDLWSELKKLVSLS